MRRVGEVRIETRDGVTRAWLDRPEARNALSPAMVEGLQGALDEAHAQRSRLLVLRGSGGTFCAGADLAHVLSLLGDRAGMDAYLDRINAFVDGLEEAPFATLALVEGFALAGGCEILLACDISLAAADARIGDRHLELGLLPGAGGSVRLARALTAARCGYLLLSGEMIDGRQAADWGLVSYAVPSEALDEVAEPLIERLGSRSGDALAGAKQLLRAAREGDFRSALEQERQVFLELFENSPDTSEGLRAFARKRTPRFGPRRGAPD